MSAWALVLVLAAWQPEIAQSRLFAATTEGAFVTYSFGEHWTRLRPDLRGFSGELRAFACLGSNVFAGGSDGIFVSDDFGENYRPVEAFEGKDVTTFQAARLFALEPTLHDADRDRLVIGDVKSPHPLMACSATPVFFHRSM